MAKSKQLKVIKDKLSNQLDELNADLSTEEVVIVCDDKSCLLASIANKMDEIINKKKTLKKQPV